MFADMWIPAFAGIGLGAVTLAVAKAIRMTRARSFFPTALVVISSFYLIFAFAEGTLSDFIINLLVAVVFTGLALLGHRLSLWFVVLGLLAHGLFDFAYDVQGGSPAPDWWGAFCLAYDLVFAVGLTEVLRSDIISSNLEE